MLRMEIETEKKSWLAHAKPSLCFDYVFFIFNAHDNREVRITWQLSILPFFLQDEHIKVKAEKLD